MSLIAVIVVVLLVVVVATLAGVSSRPGGQPDADLSGALKKLAVSRKDKVIFGVCGGLGESTPVPSWMWRALFIILAIAGGFGVIVYLVLALCMPRNGAAQ